MTLSAHLSHSLKNSAINCYAHIVFENRSLSRIASKPSIEEKYVLLKSDLRMGFVCKQIDTQPFLQKRSPNLSVLRIICEDEQALTNLNSNW